VGGDVSVTSAAIANSATINVDWASSIGNYQIASIDPTATLNTSITDVTGDVSATAAALSNSATIDGDFGYLGSTQMNGAAVNARAAVTVRDVEASVQATAASIGNSLTIKGF
jgi:hypothetical protein